MGIANVRIRPGGMLSDVVENELGQDQHQEIVNLRQNKDGEWECPSGYKNIITGFTNIKAATEITDDLSGDRFYLIQDGTSLKKVVYDIGNSPNFGYENETPTTLSLPSGVTIGASATLRFFYFRGVVRITGATVPLWYSYIDRTIFPDSWSEHELWQMETGDDTNFHGITATVVIDMTTYLEGNGSTNGSLKITQTGADGYCYDAVYLTTGLTKKYRIYCRVYKASGQSDDTFKVVVSSAINGGGTVYATETFTTTNEWIVFDHELPVATPALVYINFFPGPSQSNNIIYVDYLLIEENHQIVIQDWYLEKAEIEKDNYNFHVVEANETNLIITGALWQAIMAKNFNIFDDHQYSLLNPIERDYDPTTDVTTVVTQYDHEIVTTTYDLMRLIIRFPELNLAGLSRKRLTGFVLSFFQSAGTGFFEGVETAFEDDKVSYYMHHIFDAKEDLPPIVYNKANFYQNATYPKRLYLGVNAGDEDILKMDCYFKAGQRAIISQGGTKTMDTLVTAVHIDYTNYDSYVDFLDDIADWLTIPGSRIMGNCGVTIYRQWDYDASDGYHTTAYFEKSTYGDTPEFNDYTGIPDGTEEINPNYAHHEIIEERGYVDTSESGEEDSVRYSPLEMYDVFPQQSIIQNKVGDKDNNQAIAKRNDRLVMLKLNTLSQGNFVGGNYYEDIGLDDSGLYSPFGFKVINDILYYMDREDVFAFFGQRPVPLMVREGMRNKYRDNISTDSFIAHDKINNEIWLILKGGGSTKIFVFHPERKEWYIRETDIDPVTAFIDFDKKLVVAAGTKLVTYEHDDTDYDEAIRMYGLTRIIDDKTGEYLKKVNKIRFNMEGSGQVTVISRDPEEGTSRTKTFTPNATIKRHNRVTPRFAFKQLEIEFSTVASTEHTAKITNIEAEVEKWK